MCSIQVPELPRSMAVASVLDGPDGAGAGRRSRGTCQLRRLPSERRLPLDATTTKIATRNLHAAVAELARACEIATASMRP